MKQESVIYKNILDNMSDGVMSIDLSGRIITFNPAAARILDIKRDEVLGKNFAQIFFEYEGNDDFNQAILDAIYESNVGHNTMVDFNTAEKTVSLSLTTSFLQDRRSGKPERVGVIAVFSDVTEVKKLRDSEIRLTEDLKAKHGELQDAYLKIEESNQTLEAALKKVQVVRIMATILIIGIFLGTGLFIWNKQLISKPETTAAVSEKPLDPALIKTLTIDQRPVSSTISLPGILEPLKVINVVSPLSGKVKEKYFEYGDPVKKGQVLLEMDTSNVEVGYREAQAAYMKAMTQLGRLRNWENESEVRRSRRSLTRAKRSLESQQRKLTETEGLFRKGIVPAGEYESAKEQLHSLQLDFRAAEEELKTVLEMGSRANIRIAQLESENARVKMKELKKQIQNAAVVAPVTGVVIRPDLSKIKGEAKAVERGVSFEQGLVMVSIGDLEGLSVQARVDEVDISKIKKRQKVIISGDAFSNISLEGEISHISSQAIIKGNIPSFDIRVDVQHLSPEQKKLARLGMSANLEVVIYDNPNALMVPIGAVRAEGSERSVKIMDKETREIRNVNVETGITTIDSVEIISGLKPGDEVVVD